jgi:hypothetical protein
MCSALFAEPYKYQIMEHPYTFSTYFEMQGKNGFEGRSIKNKATLRTTYDLYDKDGSYQAQGIVQLLSLGSLNAWGKDMDIYDNNGKKIGFIDGVLLTTASAKYNFYNEHNEWVASAYLDSACSGFILTAAKGERTIGHMKRNFIENTVDNWDITIFEQGVVDMRLLKLFSTFAIDYQEYFKEDK